MQERLSCRLSVKIVRTHIEVLQKKQLVDQSNQESHNQEHVEQRNVESNNPPQVEPGNQEFDIDEDVYGHRAYAPEMNGEWKAYSEERKKFKGTEYLEGAPHNPNARVARYHTVDQVQ
ncbi:hypothetical protein [Staphylococcus phage vB_SauH_DELF3]|nr:hypothetical protein [Staphylococcus phage vB_SauH_DELF3]